MFEVFIESESQRIIYNRIRLTGLFLLLFHRNLLMSTIFDFGKTQLKKRKHCDKKPKAEGIAVINNIIKKKTNTITSKV